MYIRFYVKLFQNEKNRNINHLCKTETTLTVTSTDFDGFWLNMMSMKHDIMNLNHDNYFDLFDPFTNADLGLDPVFDYDSNLNGQLQYRKYCVEDIEYMRIHVYT